MARLFLDHVPEDFEVERDEDGFICTIAVCECDEQAIYLTLDCRLDPIHGHTPSMFEFSYGFTRADIEGHGPVYFTQDRFEVARYMGGLSSDFVIPTICGALSTLIEHVQPLYIFRVTKGRNLPQKALYKHQMVSSSLYDLGYREVETGTDGFHRTFWLMAK